MLGQLPSAEIEARENRYPNSGNPRMVVREATQRGSNLKRLKLIAHYGVRHGIVSAEIVRQPKRPS
jgi:hypothetical protein